MVRTPKNRIIMKVVTSDEAGKAAHALRIATAKAQASEKTAQAAKEKAGLAKIRFKVARRAYKKAKKAAKKASRRARQAQDELKTYTEKAAKAAKGKTTPKQKAPKGKGHQGGHPNAAARGGGQTQGRFPSARVDALCR